MTTVMTDGGHRTKQWACILEVEFPVLGVYNSSHVSDGTLRSTHRSFSSAARYTKGKRVGFCKGKYDLLPVAALCSLYLIMLADFRG